MDPRRGVLSDADVLVRGTTIDAVGQRLSAPANATVIDAAGAPLLPGFVDVNTDDARQALKHTRDFGLPLSTHAGLYGFVGDDNIRFLEENVIRLRSRAAGVTRPR
ncbi:hypothetical protein ACWCQQ_22520 [Streptomyces sp. NPDC002143]